MHVSMYSLSVCVTATHRCPLPEFPTGGNLGVGGGGETIWKILSFFHNIYRTGLKVALRIRSFAKYVLVFQYLYR